MSQPTYTHLETLLLFQALRADGVASISFNQISNQLSSIPLVRDDPTYDAARLSGGALRELYLALLKDEARQELEQDGDTHATNGVTSPGSLKRKAPSPTLPTVQEAVQHSHLIPQLVTRLYTNYREKTIRELREYERQYEVLARDVSEIEAGRWDERLQRQESVSSTRSPKPSTSAHTQPALARLETAQPSKIDTATSTPAVKPVESGAQAAPKKYSQSKIDTLINHGPEPQPSPGGHRRTSSNTTLPPLSEMAPQSPRFGIPPKIPGPVSQMPHMQQAPPHAYNHSPPSGQQSPYPAHHAHPGSNPQLQGSFSRPSSSPRPILPPPPGMKLPQYPPQHAVSPSLHGPPIVPPQQYYQPQHRGSAGPSPTNDRPPRGHAPPHQTHPQAYYPQQPQYQDRRTSYPPPQVQPPPNYPTQPPHHGGYQLQPFSVNASNQPAKQPPKATPQQPKQTFERSYFGKPAPDFSNMRIPQRPATGPRARPLPPQNPRLISDIVAALATPPRKPLWKHELKPTPLDERKVAPESPGFEPLSPAKERAKLATRPGRPTRRSAAADAEESPAVPQRQNTRRKRPARERSPTSSTVGESRDARTRSQSVSTAAGVLSDARPASRSGHIKHEMSSPAATTEAPDAHIEPAATPLSGPMTRKRRGTLQTNPQPPPSKRKRPEPAAATSEQDVEDASTPPPRPTTITATRNFAKLSATIMNDINSHKHASYFAGPVRDRDATGYSDIVKQPQSLKGIRTAISAGTRAVAAAADSPSTAAEVSSATIELERSEDLVPPRAIVNAAQLEKEVYRMLANAVVFNPGEDGLVGEAREMFGDVEALVGEWRRAEVEEEVGEEGRGKRRKF